MNWLQFFHNIGDYLFYPTIGVTVAAAICFVRLAKSEEKNSPESTKAYEARWWTTALVQISVISWIVVVLCRSVPTPESSIKYVDRVQYVNKIDNRMELYNQTYHKCRSEMYSDNVPDSIKDQQCRDRSMLLSIPDLKIIQKTITIYRTDPYSKLYATCMGDWNMKEGHIWPVDGPANETQARNFRMETCHKHAIEVIQAEK